MLVRSCKSASLPTRRDTQTPSGTAFVLIVCFAAGVALSCSRRSSQALESEFREVTPLPDCRQVAYQAPSWDDPVLSVYYATELGRDKIAGYYDVELKRLGWTLEGEQPVADWGRDFGGSLRRYVRGDGRAVVQYAGRDANYGWSFSIAFTMGSEG